MPPYKQIDVVVVHEAFVDRVKDAWQYLLENGKKIAQDAEIKPEDIILGGSLRRLVNIKVLLIYSSHTRWDASRFLHKRLSNSTIWNKPKQECNRSLV